MSEAFNKSSWPYFKKCSKSRSDPEQEEEELRIISMDDAHMGLEGVQRDKKSPKVESVENTFTTYLAMAKKNGFWGDL